MKILILNGSPHLDKGATGTILNEFKKGLQIENPEIITKNIYQLNVKPCKGCFTCWTQTPGKCTQKDDMEDILPLVAESDILVIGTPLYVDGMTGPMKTFFDRIIPLGKGRVELRNNRMRHLLREKMKKKKFALVSPSGFAEIENFNSLISHINAIASNFDSVYAGEVLAPSFWYYKYNEESYRKIIETIVSAGEELVKNGSIPSHISQTLLANAPREIIMEVMNKHFGKFE
ncbi:MAG: flavodoxin family protein [Candidatus Bathyarchaeota archaeon]|nr:flavodoxin family protein [Candidatus Bathyarchaeota archaeon]